MERDQELLKLINVLRRTGRMASQAHWTGEDKDAAAFCANKYNRVLARLKELDETVGAVFEPLPADSSLTVTAIACRQLAAYYEDELGAAGGFRGAYGFAFDPRWFARGKESKRDCRNFWREAGHDIEDLGEFIRESIAEWTRHRRPAKETTQEGTEPEANNTQT
jgi:hypothetical protein